MVVVVYKQTAADCHLTRPQPQSSAAANYFAAKLSAVAALLGQQPIFVVVHLISVE